LKENVIAGKNIPAGTGAKVFRDFIVNVKEPELPSGEEMAVEEVMNDE